MLVSAQFISFIPVELILAAFRAGIMPQRGVCFELPLAGTSRMR
jgi:hypothetical protein